MGTFLRPWGVPMAWGFFAWQMALLIIHFYYLFFEDESVPTDFASNTFRSRPMGPVFIVFGVMLMTVSCAYFSAGVHPTLEYDYTLDQWGETNPYGVFPLVGEDMFVVTITSMLHSLSMLIHLSLDAALMVGGLMYIGGIMFSILKYIFEIGLFGGNPFEWYPLTRSISPTIFGYLICMGLGSRIWRWRKTHSWNDGVRVKSLEEFEARLAYSIRFARTNKIMLAYIWIFVAEEFFVILNYDTRRYQDSLDAFHTHVAFAVIYIVVVIALLIGCINEFRQNEF